MNRGSAWILPLVVALAACSSGSEQASEAGGDAAADADVAPDGSGELGGDLAEDTLEIPDVPRPASCPSAAWVTSLRGAVVDEAGAPLEGAKVQLCLRVSETDRLLCLRPADSAADGSYAIVVPDEGRCMSRAVVRVIRPLEAMASTYCELDLSGGEANLELSAPFQLFATTPATTLPPEGDATAERTVVFADGLEVDVVPDRLFLGGDGYEGLAARRVSADSAGLCFAPAALGLDGLYAFSPEGDVTDESLTVRIPAAGLAAGETATLYVLGALNCTLPDDTLLEEGLMHEVGTATVDGSGAFLEASGEAGLPCFSWLGYRIDP